MGSNFCQLNRLPKDRSYGHFFLYGLFTYWNSRWKSTIRIAQFDFTRFSMIVHPAHHPLPPYTTTLPWIKKVDLWGPNLCLWNLDSLYYWRCLTFCWQHVTYSRYEKKDLYEISMLFIGYNSFRKASNRESMVNTTHSAVSCNPPELSPSWCRPTGAVWVGRRCPWQTSFATPEKCTQALYATLIIKCWNFDSEIRAESAYEYNARLCFVQNTYEKCITCKKCPLKRTTLTQHTKHTTPHSGWRSLSSITLILERNSGSRKYRNVSHVGTVIAATQAAQYFLLADAKLYFSCCPVTASIQ